ncbi:phage head closure protein [Rhodovulum sp. YEN HP10]|uniref:phage head closure protein n=1 Tax=Rhodovulum sp. HP10 TaxID=3387397 RepID=UPI0039DF59A1
MTIRRNCRVTFERHGEGRNALNEKVGKWQRLGAAWGARTDLSEIERAAAGQIGAVRAARFTLRRSDLVLGLTAADRMKAGGHVWNITGVTERGRWVDVSAVSNGRKEEA